MTELALVLGGAAVGAAWTWILREQTFRVLREQIVSLRTAEAQATDRLVGAWQGGAQIPPRPVDVKPPEPLPPELLERVQEWESAETRAVVERKVREWYFERGWGVPAIVKHLDTGLVT